MKCCHMYKLYTFNFPFICFQLIVFINISKNNANKKLVNYEKLKRIIYIKLHGTQVKRLVIKINKIYIIYLC